jgi:hypothetical protein
MTSLGPYLSSVVSLSTNSIPQREQIPGLSDPICGSITHTYLYFLVTGLSLAGSPQALKLNNKPAKAIVMIDLMITYF